MAPPRGQSGIGPADSDGATPSRQPSGDRPPRVRGEPAVRSPGRAPELLRRNSDTAKGVRWFKGRSSRSTAPARVREPAIATTWCGGTSRPSTRTAPVRSDGPTLARTIASGKSGEAKRTHVGRRGRFEWPRLRSSRWTGTSRVRAGSIATTSRRSTSKPTTNR